MALSKFSRDILKTLNGQEISSLKYEDVVGVRGNKIIRYGKVIDTINTDKKAKELLNEANHDEFGSDGEFKASIEAEFGKYRNLTPAQFKKALKKDFPRIR